MGLFWIYLGPWSGRTWPLASLEAIRLVILLSALVSAGQISLEAVAWIPVAVPAMIAVAVAVALITTPAIRTLAQRPAASPVARRTMLRTSAGPYDRPAVILAVALAAVTALALVVFHVAADSGSGAAAGAVVAGAVLAGGALVYPRAAAAGVAGLVAVHAGPVLTEQTGVPSVERAGLLVVAAILVAMAWLRRERLPLPSEIVAAAALFLGARIATGLVAPYDVDIDLTVRSGLYGLILVAVLALAASDMPTMRLLCAGAVGAASLVSGLTLLKAAGIGGDYFGFAAGVIAGPEAIQAQLRSLEPQGAVDRVSGPLGDPNFWAQAMVLLVPLAIWLATSRGRPALRLVGALGAALLLAGIVATESRGGLIALMVSAAVAMWLAGGRARRLALVVPLAVALALVAATGTGDRFAQLQDIRDPATAEDFSVTGRVSEALVAVEMFEDYPLTGIGAGNYIPLYGAYAPDIGLDDRQEREPHNSYLEIGAESGAVGMVAFVALIFTAIWAAVTSAQMAARNGDGEARRLGIAIAAGLSGYAVGAIFLHQAYPEYLWLGIGFAGAALGLARRRWPDPASPSRIAATSRASRAAWEL